MHHFDPTRSYKGADENGITSLATAEMSFLTHKFLGVKVRVRVTITPTLDQLEKLIAEMPEAFSDVAPLPEAEMSATELEEQKKFEAELSNPDSFSAKFRAWLKSRPAA